MIALSRRSVRRWQARRLARAFPPLALVIAVALLASGCRLRRSQSHYATPAPRPDWDPDVKTTGCPKLSTETPTELTMSAGTLRGTLVLPAGCGPFPVVLIHAGSGPTDRDGNVGVAVRTDAYRLLSTGLAAGGYASVRYDKRGIGESAGAGPGSEEAYRFSMYVDDAVAWIGALRADPRFRRVILVGHSEGSLIGMVAARRAKVDAFVSLEGAGRPAGAIVRAQLARQLAGPPLVDAVRVLDSLESGHRFEPLPPGLAPATEKMFRPSIQPYLISWFRYDPATELAALGAPALVVQGATDTQVSVDDAKRLAGASHAAKLLVLPSMAHPLKAASADPEAQRAAYTDPSLPLAPGLMEGILAFLGPP